MEPWEVACKNDYLIYPNIFLDLIDNIQVVMQEFEQLLNILVRPGPHDA